MLMMFLIQNNGAITKPGYNPHNELTELTMKKEKNNGNS